MKILTWCFLAAEDPSSTVASFLCHAKACVSDESPNLLFSSVYPQIVLRSSSCHPTIQSCRQLTSPPSRPPARRGVSSPPPPDASSRATSTRTACCSQAHHCTAAPVRHDPCPEHLSPGSPKRLSLSARLRLLLLLHTVIPQTPLAPHASPTPAGNVCSRSRESQWGGKVGL